MPAEETRTRYQVTFAVLATATIAYALLQSLVVPVLATIQSGLHTSQNSVTWVLTAYLLSASIFTPIIGRLGDMFGKERMLVVALVALAAGCLLAAITNSLIIMIIARVIQGVGGGVLPLSFGLIRDEFPQEKVAGAVGVIAALAAAGAGLGIALAGPIVEALDYHWLFWIPMIILVFAAVAAYVVVPESRVRTAGRVNWLAAALLSAWLVALILAVSEAPTWGWTSGKVIGLIIAAVVLGIVWFVVESRSANPLIDMHMMRIPTVWTTNLVALLLGIGMYAAFAFLPQYLETPPAIGYGFGTSITEAGLILLPMSVGMFIFGSLSGRFSARYGTRAVLIAGTTIGAVPFVLLTIARDHEWEILISMVLLGIGFGLALLSNVKPGGPSSSPRADRRGQRNERQHPNDWWCAGSCGHEQHRDRRCASPRLSPRRRVYQRLSRADNRGCGRGGGIPAGSAHRRAPSFGGDAGRCPAR